MSETTTKPSNKLPALLLAVVLIGGGFYLVAKALRGTAPTYNATVTGNVTIDGQLASSGLVAFHPSNGGQPATGTIHSDGSFSLRSGQGDMQDVDGGTIASGGYIVTVSINGASAGPAMEAEGGPPRPGPSLIATRYSSKETSDLQRVVEPGANVIVLNLEGADTTEVEQAQQSAEELEQGGELPAEQPVASGEADAETQPNETQEENP